MGGARKQAKLTFKGHVCQRFCGRFIDPLSRAGGDWDRSKVVAAQVRRQRQILTPSWRLGAISDNISTAKPAVIEPALRALRFSLPVFWVDSVAYGACEINALQWKDVDFSRLARAKSQYGLHGNVLATLL
jgi:hypothetical protein